MPPKFQTVTDLLLSSLREVVLILEKKIVKEEETRVTLSISELNDKERLKQIRIALESHIPR
jgi:hypothetical protein